MVGDLIEEAQHIIEEHTDDGDLDWRDEVIGILIQALNELIS